MNILTKSKSITSINLNIDDKDISENESNEPYFVGAFNKDEWFEVLRKDLRVDLLEWSEEGKNINLIKDLAKDNR